MKKRILTTILSLCLLMVILPTTALAAENNEISIKIDDTSVAANYEFNYYNLDYALPSAVKHAVEDKAAGLGINVSDITKLTISTSGNARIHFADCRYIAQEMTGLTTLDITNADFIDDGYVEWAPDSTNIDHKIPIYAFQGAAQLQQVYPFSGTNRDVSTKFTAMSNDVFAQTGLSGEITIPKTVAEVDGFNATQITGVNKADGVNYLDGNIKKIGAACFYQTASLTGGISFGENVTSIGWGAFCGTQCSGDIVFGGAIKEIGTQVFNGCKEITSVRVGSQITSFDANSAFANCTKLESVIFEDGAAVTIGANAFNGCSSLRYVYCGDNSTLGRCDLVGSTNIVLAMEEEATNGNLSLLTGGIVYVSDYSILNTMIHSYLINPANLVIADLGGGKLSDQKIFSESTLANPSKGEYTPGGWYEVTNKTDWTLADAPLGNNEPVKGKTYICKWVSEIAFDANGGECETAAATVPESESLTESDITLPTPTRTGYIFNGWYTAAEGGAEVTAATVPTGNATYYAQWTPIEYTVRFDGNSSDSGTMTELRAIYDTPDTLPPNGFKKADYKFAGWADSPEKAADGTIDFSDSSQIENLTAINNDIITLYAVWTKKAEVPHPTVSVQSYTYNSAPQEFKLEGFNVSYKQKGSEVTNPTNAGSYDVEITRAETDDTAAFHSYLYGGLVIEKAPLTVSADSKTIYVGDNLPDYTYTVIGWQGNDTFVTEPNLTCSAASADTTGTYDIIADGADAGDNYEITYKAGKLTVRGRSNGSSNNNTESATNPDGSTTTTVTDNTTGTVTETTKHPDGSTTVVETKKDGAVTTTETRADGVKTVTADEPDKDTTVSVIIPASVGTTTVTIPTAVSSGTVAVDAKTGKVVQLSVPTEDGMLIKLDSSAELVLEDRSKNFDDTKGHWAEDSIDFVVAHGLFNGTGETTFSPNSPMTRAMLMTVLARFDGQDTEGGATWYEKGMEWAMQNGISDGTNPNSFISREQLAAMLYRYAGSPAADGSISQFPDADKVSDYAVDAMRWAVSAGIINGMTDGTLAPRDNSTRAQVATIFMRFCTNQTKAAADLTDIK